MKYRIAPGTLRADLGAEEVILNAETGTYHAVNTTGRLLLAAFDHGLTFDEAVSEVATEMRVEVERVRVDATSFVERMLQRGLLVPDDPSTDRLG